MNRFGKRQVEVSRSIVHVTITAAGTVVYTQTATSYSYVPSYSTVTPTSTSLPASNITNNSNNPPSPSNTGAIVGGAVGGVAAIALAGLAFLLLRRRSRREGTLIVDDSDSYYDGHRHQRSSSKATILGGSTAGVTMTSHTPTPRHLVAPPESRQHGPNGYYYDDILATYPKGYYSNSESVTTDSLPSTAVVDNRHVPNEALYNSEERHVPHLKDDFPIEPPHTKD